MYLQKTINCICSTVPRGLFILLHYENSQQKRQIRFVPKIHFVHFNSITTTYSFSDEIYYVFNISLEFSSNLVFFYARLIHGRVTTRCESFICIQYKIQSFTPLFILHVSDSFLCLRRMVFLGY